MTRTKTQKMVQIALIGALYTVLTLAVAPISFGAVQFRISEALTLLPLFSPVGIWGLAFGCLVSNLIGFFTGLNPIGLIDAPVGTLATLLAGLVTYYIGRRDFHAEQHKDRLAKMILGALPPVLFNGAIIGLELTLVFGGEPGQNFAALYAFNAGSVAFGELAVCYTLGMALCAVLWRRDLYKRCFGETGCVH
ncbi:MAG: QueT transporter family protein [Oscillospiraceae bacterium]|jgi:uncharacterized membrane protein|nr:QueT transporter family protein [Oscillospiraceae bacterium]